MAEPQRREPRKPAGQVVAEEVLAGHERFLEDVFKRVPKDAPKRVRYVVKAVPHLGGVVYGGAQFLTAKDKWRAGAEAVGGALGGMAGGAMGAATGPAAPVAAPAGAAVGSAAGAELATDLYDANYDRIHPVTRAVEDSVSENWRRIKETADWIHDRNRRKSR